MQMLWTWGGKFFGYRDGDDLWTHDGRHVGRFRGDNAFDQHGRYLGEVMQRDRLITSTTKGIGQTGIFTPYAKRAGIARYANYAGYAMYAGYRDFPSPDSLA